MPMLLRGTGFVQATGKFNHRLKDRNRRIETLLWFHFRFNRCFSKLEMRKREREREREMEMERPSTGSVTTNW